MEHAGPIKVDKYIYLSSSASTNQYANELSSKSSPHGIICIYTAHQTHGRGQIGRKWYSGNGKNLAVSYLVPYRLDLNKHFDLNRMLSLALIHTLSSILPVRNLRIKWPNDIYFNDRKLAGLLIQNQLRGSLISQSILGVGLNINEDDFPKGIPNPVSIFQITGARYSLLTILAELEKQVLYYLEKLYSDSNSLRVEYEDYLYRKNETCAFTLLPSDKKVKGTVLGVSAEGQLELGIDGKIMLFNFHEIRMDIKKGHPSDGL